MYKFIKEQHEECKLRPDDICSFEEKFDIRLPFEMAEFYLQFNGLEIYLSKIEKDTTIFQVDAFYSIKHSFSSRLPTVDTLIEWDRMDGFVDYKMVPFAKDQGGDSYYCDSASGEIYIIRSDDIDIPIKICDTFTEFLSALDIYNGNY